MIEHFSQVNLTEEKLTQWAKSGLNVMLVGKHGVGKTQRVMKVFNDIFGQLGVDWLYLSGGLMDPWIDFMGVPEKVIDKETGQAYLEFVRRKAFATGTVKAIFIDEYNRTAAQVRNGTMELIQFHSLNGVKFPNLTTVWVAVNPFSEEEGDNKYDVERLDEAQADRFQIIIHVPFRPDRAYFAGKFGEDIAQTAISWWNQQPKGKNSQGKDIPGGGIQGLISPRRLDYALEAYIKMGLPDGLDLTLPKGADIKKLRNDLNQTPRRAEMRRIFSLRTTDVNAAVAQAKTFWADEINYTDCVSDAINSAIVMEFHLVTMPEEKISVLIEQHPKVKTFCINSAHRLPPIKKVLEQIIEASANKTLVAEIKRGLGRQVPVGAALSSADRHQVNPNRAPPWFQVHRADIVLFDKTLEDIKKMDPKKQGWTHYRMTCMQDINSCILKDVPFDIAVKALEVLNDPVIGRTHANTVSGWEKDQVNPIPVMGIINHLIGCTQNDKGGPMTCAEFMKKFPRLARYCVMRDDFYWAW